MFVVYHTREESPLTGHNVFLYDDREIHILGWFRKYSGTDIPVTFQNILDEYHKLQPDDFEYTNTLRAIDKKGQYLLVHISDIVGYDNLPS